MVLTGSFCWMVFVFMMSLRFVWSPDESGHTARSDASGSGFQGQGPLFRKVREMFCVLCKRFSESRTPQGATRSRGPQCRRTPVKSRARARFNEDHGPGVR